MRRKQPARKITQRNTIEREGLDLARRWRHATVGACSGAFVSCAGARPAPLPRVPVAPCPRARHDGKPKMDSFNWVLPIRLRFPRCGPFFLRGQWGTRDEKLWRPRSHPDRPAAALGPPRPLRLRAAAGARKRLTRPESLRCGPGWLAHRCDLMSGLHCNRWPEGWAARGGPWERAGVRGTLVSDRLSGVRPTRPARDSRAAISQHGLLRKPLFV